MLMGKQKSDLLKPTKKTVISEFKRTWQLHLLLLPAFIYIFVFGYIPMGGLVMAFEKYVPNKGFLGSEWVGFAQFVKFFKSYQFSKLIANTLRITIYSLLVSFPLPVIFALLLNVMRNQGLKKSIQTITYIPHFISAVVVVGMIFSVFSSTSGAYGSLYKLFGGEGFPKDFVSKLDSFVHLYVWSGVWQEMGWSSIIYLAALSGVDPGLHEAAMLDGASRWKRIWTVDLPAIMPTVIIMLIMNSGYLMSIGYEKVFLMQTDLNLMKSEVISTYVYKIGLANGTNYSYATAINLFNSVLNCIILVIVNTVSKKLSHDEISLF